MSDWIPEGYIDATALVRECGVDKVRNDLFNGRRQAFRWNTTNGGPLHPIASDFWCAEEAGRCLKEGGFPPPFRVIVRVEDEPPPSPVIDGVYLPPFMVLMLTALRHFNISEQHCPMKKELEQYFRAQKVDGKPVSRNLASRLATFCRPPAAMRGGNRKKG